MTNAFIVHVEEDQAAALDIAIALEERGYLTWCYEVDNPVGGDYVKRILEAVKAAEVLVVLVSPNALERRDQVSREIFAGNGKPFMPVLWDLSLTRYDRVVPRTWLETFGNAVATAMTPRRVTAAVDKIVAGMVAAGIQPRGGVDERMANLRRVRADIPPEPWVRRTRREVRAWTNQARDFLSNVAALIAIGLVAAAAIAYLIVPRPERPPKEHFILWVEDAVLEPKDDSALQVDYAELREQIESALTDVFEKMRDVDVLHGVPEVEFIKKVDEHREIAACRGLSDDGERRDCVAIVDLGVDAKISGTLRARGQRVRDLHLEVRRARDLKFSGFTAYDCRDQTTITTTAKCAAARVAGSVTQSLALDRNLQTALRDHIHDVLDAATDDKGVANLDKTFGDFGPPEPGARFLPSFVREAFADNVPPSPNDQSVTQVEDALKHFSSALATRQPDNVKPFFVQMTDGQRDAFQNYFDNMDPDHDLNVSFIEPVITLEGEKAKAAFLRVDTFFDRDSHRPVRLAVRLVAVLVRVDGQWKVESLKRPS